MRLRQKNKINPNFQMSSLTDIVFLLLIFFMLTSSFIVSNALDLELPGSNSTETVKTKVSVSINKNREFFVNYKQVSVNQIESKLKEVIDENTDATVVLEADKSVPIEDVARVMSVANDLQVKMILATQKQK